MDSSGISNSNASMLSWIDYGGGGLKGIHFTLTKKNKKHALFLWTNVKNTWKGTHPLFDKSLTGHVLFYGNGSLNFVHIYIPSKNNSIVVTRSWFLPITRGR